MIKKKDYNEPITIDLTGPEGNAYFLLRSAQTLGRKLGMDNQEIETLLGRMKSGDYDNLVKVLDEKFGDFIILLTK